MKLTKHKTNTPGQWRVHVDGRATALIISKGDLPRYRENQMYDLTTEGDDGYLFEAPGVGIMLGRLERIAAELVTP